MSLHFVLIRRWVSQALAPSPVQLCVSAESSHSWRGEAVQGAQVAGGRGGAVQGTQVPGGRGGAVQGIQVPWGRGEAVQGAHVPGGRGGAVQGAQVPGGRGEAVQGAHVPGGGQCCAGCPGPSSSRCPPALCYLGKSQQPHSSIFRQTQRFLPIPSEASAGRGATTDR